MAETSSVPSRLPFRAGRRLALFALAAALGLAGVEAGAAPASSPSWGAIATQAPDQRYGYAFDHATREAAERAARAQCERAVGRAGSCEVRTFFDRSCGAVAKGNHGEWATATAATSAVAGREAAAQCDRFLPTEPCKVVVSVCSQR